MDHRETNECLSYSNTLQGILVDQLCGLVGDRRGYEISRSIPDAAVWMLGW